ncbi:MAG: hypothetical protein VR73_14585 [Gammaproteobacteria bacterium BRH_c0]|nr:MAG: hypothetical protein VR73_14585 [Gammaproteobacteria bacterium BRH_c0]
MVRGHKGFTLIELMITVALIAILAMAAVPFTASWLHATQVQTAGANLEQAFAKAKALALRNPAGVTGSDSAASVKLSGSTVIVCAGAPGDAGCVVGGGAVAWQGDVTGGVTIQLAGAALTSIVFDNSGQAIDASGNALAILDVDIAKGAASHDAHLY